MRLLTLNRSTARVLVVRGGGAVSKTSVGAARDRETPSANRARARTRREPARRTVSTRQRANGSPAARRRATTTVMARRRVRDNRLPSRRKSRAPDPTGPRRRRLTRPPGTASMLSRAARASAAPHANHGPAPNTPATTTAAAPPAQTPPTSRPTHRPRQQAVDQHLSSSHMGPRQYRPVGRQRRS